MGQELAVKTDNTPASTDLLSDFQAFENAQRIGKMLSQSQIIPASYQNNLPNVIVAMEIAARNKLSPIVVMQNLNVIKGRPTWSSKYIIAALTTSRVNNLHYETTSDGNVTVSGFGGNKTIVNLMCRAIANDKASGEERIGPWVSMKMAIDEGWYGKDGSKWKTMPELMIRYRAVTFFANIFYPEITIGIDTEDSMPEAVPAPVVKKEAVEVGEITKPAEEAPVKPKRTKKEVKDDSAAKAEAEKTETEPKDDEPETVEAEFEEVSESETKPVPVAAPQTDDSDEWDNWGE